MNTKTNELLIWIDTETTGLDANQCALLEVACLVTDTDLNVLDDTGYRAVVHHSPEQVRELYRNTAPFVQEMHTKNGLWGLLSNPDTATPLGEVESGLLAYIKQFAPNPRQGYLAGNSVNLDANFLAAHIPLVWEHLHYRLVDMSGLQTVVDWWAPEVGHIPKGDSHRAFDDILASIAQAKHLKSQVFETKN